MTTAKDVTEVSLYCGTAVGYINHWLMNLNLKGCHFLI